MAREISEILLDGEIDPEQEVPQKVLEDTVKHVEKYINRDIYRQWRNSFWGRVYWNNYTNQALKYGGSIEPLRHIGISRRRNPIKCVWSYIISRPFMQKIAKQKQEKLLKKLDKDYPSK